LPIWDRFREIPLTLGCTYDSLLAHIDRTMRLEEPWPVRSLSSAVRIFVFEYLEAVAGGDAIERALTIAANTQIKGYTSHAISIAQPAQLSQRTDALVPHLPEINGVIWEPACGAGKMASLCSKLVSM
jgi:predicted DNA-binding ribbon-helix-helix protein